jgi:GNAT superfamily N-acetyltransferase
MGMRDDSDVLEFRRADAAAPPAAELIDAMVAEMVPLYGNINVPGAPTATPADMGPPGGAFVVGYEEGKPICGGGIKRLPDGACEIKRMYVVPEARGRGAGRELLAALEDAARALGHTIARLDTGSRQPGAERMYRAAGYAPIANFNANPVASFFGEKRL